MIDESPATPSFVVVSGVLPSSDTIYLRLWNGVWQTHTRKCPFVRVDLRHLHCHGLRYRENVFYCHSGGDKWPTAVKRSSDGSR